MITDRKNAEQKLAAEESLTLVLCKGSEYRTDTRRGIAPMLDLLASGINLNGFSAADRVVGKAVALLFVQAGIRAVYAGVVSEAALLVFAHFGISCTYALRVDYIINRAGTGQCPMERAVRDTIDPAEAERMLREELKRLK